MSETAFTVRVLDAGERHRGCENGVSECRPLKGMSALVVVDGTVLCTAHATWEVGARLSALGLHAALRDIDAQRTERDAHEQTETNTPTDEGVMDVVHDALPEHAHETDED